MINVWQYEDVIQLIQYNLTSVLDRLFLNSSSFIINVILLDPLLTTGLLVYARN